VVFKKFHKSINVLFFDYLNSICSLEGALIIGQSIGLPKTVTIFDERGMNLSRIGINMYSKHISNPCLDPPVLSLGNIV
jgi:hypothetical protein